MRAPLHKAFAFFLLVFLLQSCQISGYDSGMCVDFATVKDRLSFCGEYLTGTICIPDETDRFKFISIEVKESQLKTRFLNNLAKRMLEEFNGTTSDNQFTQNPHCFSAYKNLICKWNYPQCDANSNTKSVCMEHCMSFVKECSLNEDICTLTYIKFVS